MRASLLKIAAFALPHPRATSALLPVSGRPWISPCTHIPSPVHIPTSASSALAHSLSLYLSRLLTQRMSLSRIHSRNQFLRHCPTAIKTFLTHAFPFHPHARTRHFGHLFCLVSAPSHATSCHVYTTQPHATSTPHTSSISSCSRPHDIISTPCGTHTAPHPHTPAG